MYEEIKPIYNINEKFKKTILDINKEIKNININDKKRTEYLKLKSKVRSIHFSLAIEANSLSLKNVSDIINNEIVIGKKSEVQEVKNAVELYDNINEYDWKSEKDFLKAHTLLMKYFDDDNGYYRNHGEGVKKGNKIIFTAPESLVVPNLMKSLFTFINNCKEHPLIIASIFHYYLVYIHPFSDGNGRIARFWVSLILKDYNVCK